MKANRAARDEAVTDVLGTILMVAITVMMMVGLSVLILSIDGPSDQTFVELSISLLPGGLAWGEGDEEVLLVHGGGEALKRDDARVTISINGVVTTYEGAALDGDFADGSLTLGESWGKSDLTIPVNASVDVNFIGKSGNNIVASAAMTASSSLASSTLPATTYVGSEIVTTASSAVDFINAQNDADGDAVATYIETSVPGGSSTTTLSPGNINNFNVETGDATPVLVDDGNDAQMLTTSHFIHVDQFDVPTAALAVTKVVIGFEGERKTGAATDPIVRLTYSGIGGIPSSQDFALGQAEAERTLDVTADRLWTIADIESMVLEVNVILGSTKVIDIDHMYVTVTYNEAPQTDLALEYAWTGVPDRAIEQFQIRYQATGDTFQVQVWNGVAWTVRGSLTSTTLAVFSYSMSTAEYNGGAPKIRFVDLDSGTLQGTLEIEYARVQSA